MNLNGWQRLWVVASAVWVIPVLVVVCVGWPTAIRVLDADVYGRMNPVNFTRLAAARGYISMDPQWGIPVPVNPDSGAPVALVRFIPAAVEVEGHTLSFVPIYTAQPESKYDPAIVVEDYTASLHRALRVRRVVFAGVAVGAWAGPVAFLYVLGWAVAWIRRGFSHPR